MVYAKIMYFIPFVDGGIPRNCLVFACEGVFGYTLFVVH